MDTESRTISALPGDKRRWPIGTLVTATLTGGSRLETVTTSVPRMFGAGSWGVRVRGAACALALDRVSLRIQPDLFRDDAGGSDGSETDTSTPDGGRRAG